MAGSGISDRLHPCKHHASAVWPSPANAGEGHVSVSKKSFRHDETSFRASKSSEKWGSSSCRTPFPGFPHTPFRPVDERFPLFWQAHMTLPGVCRRGSCIVYLRAVQIQHSIWNLLTNPSDRPPSPFSAFPATGAGPPKVPPPGTAGRSRRPPR